MSTSAKAENINNSFFEGYYKDIWKQVFPEKTTMAEVDFIISAAGLDKGSRVLDLMCGYGRHALELAKRGIKVTAVDNLADYTNEIKEKALAGNLEIECIREDVQELQLEQEYDAVLCMGNSLQFFNYDDTIKLLFNISRHLMKGGKFFVNTWSITEIAVKQFSEKTWGKIGEITYLNESKWLFQPTRIETISIMIAENGEKEERKSVDYIFSISELETMLINAGISLKEIYSIPGKKKFTVGEPRAYIVAEKQA
jgi:cyclopropane fatty-acyl-phospholipid synthase-like methyltransferase